MSDIIFPLYHFAPVSIAPPIILPPGNGLMIYAICPCPVSFCPLDSFCPLSFCPWNLLYTIYPCPISFCPRIIPLSHIILPPYHPPISLTPYHFDPWKLFHDLHYFPMSRIILPPALDFIFILIKSPLQLKLMTGAHPVTVAPLVRYDMAVNMCTFVKLEKKFSNLLKYFSTSNQLFCCLFSRIG